jgi:hypothetical protein
MPNSSGFRGVRRGWPLCLVLLGPAALADDHDLARDLHEPQAEHIEQNVLNDLVRRGRSPRPSRWPSTAATSSSR